MQMNRVIPILAILFLDIQFAKALELEDVEDSLKNQGAEATISKLSWPYENWFNFTKNIQSGEISWVQLAIELRPATDGGGSMDIDHSLAEAYSMNPNAFPVDVSPSLVCNPNHMDLDTKPNALAYISRMKNIIPNTKSAKFRENCTQLIDNYENIVSEWDGQLP